MFFWVFTFLEFLNLLGHFLNWKKQFPMQPTHSSSTVVPKSWVLHYFFLFFPLAFAHMILSVLWPSWGSLSGSVWQHLCWPWYVFVGSLCYRRPFLHVSGKGLKALSAADIPGYHFDVKLLSWEIKQHMRENCIVCKGLASSACTHLFLYCQVKETQNCLIGSLFMFCSNKAVLEGGGRNVPNFLPHVAGPMLCPFFVSIPLLCIFPALLTVYSFLKFFAVASWGSVS